MLNPKVMELKPQVSTASWLCSLEVCVLPSPSSDTFAQEVGALSSWQGTDCGRPSRDRGLGWFQHAACASVSAGRPHCIWVSAPLGDHFPKRSPAPPFCYRAVSLRRQGPPGRPARTRMWVGAVLATLRDGDHLRELQQRPSLPTQMLLGPVRVASVSWDQALSLFEVALAWWWAMTGSKRS